MKYALQRKAEPAFCSICYPYDSPTRLPSTMNHESFLTAYEQALALQSWDALGPFIDDNACFVFSDGTYVGKKQIERAIRATFALIKTKNIGLRMCTGFTSAATARCVLIDSFGRD